MLPDDPITKHFRLTPVQLSALKRLGISSVYDLLRHFPARYDQGGSESTIAGLVAGTEVTIFGTIGNLETRRSWKRKIPVGEAIIRDASGSIKVMWFHQPYLAKKFHDGMFVKAVGTVTGKTGKPYLANPHVETTDPVESGLLKATPFRAEESPSPTLFAVYPESRGVTSLWFRHALERVFASGVQTGIDDPIPSDIRAHYNLPDINTALVWIHRPENLKHAEAARKRFAFEEIFTIQVARARERAENDAQESFPIKNGEEHAARFLSTIPFPPTSAQNRAIKDILDNFEGQHPMARLLEGDVGSGKTLVAATSAYAVVNSRPPKTPAKQVFGRTFSQGKNVLGPQEVELRESGTLQVAYMAPTEILATQHFESFIEFFSHLPINIALMTGSGCKKFPSKISKDKATDISRAQLLKWVENGEIAMLVGTHALIQKSVQFQHLALCVVDEQHRFGTRQRRALAQKNRGHIKSDAVPEAGKAGKETYKSTATSTQGPRNEEMRRFNVPMPHFLSMTATPIPRTLALTLYGDLDISVLDELPPGRAQISTAIVKPRDREAMYEKVRSEIRSGRQAYVICPRIEDPDPANMNALQAKSAKAEAVRLKKDIFPEFEIGLLHGAMKPKEKEGVMKDFSDGAIQVLVATSVVEVGINVPNATLIVIEGAERFGLAQLHQLRGRVQRSSHPPHCFLLSESVGSVALRRLRALEQSSDGFKLAEADLESRGAGDLYGERQWGMTDLGMEALKNIRLISAARDEAQKIVHSDSSLQKYPALAARVESISLKLHQE